MQDFNLLPSTSKNQLNRTAGFLMSISSSRAIYATLFGLLLSSLSSACIDSGRASDGLAIAPADQGPGVVWDLDATPLPEIPFPNDIATRLDPRSPTGRRVNISTQADTHFESDLREKADQLSGFGIFSNLTVSFDAPLDLCNIARRHHHDKTPEDDAIYLVDVTEGSHFGERINLDMGRGFFPLQLESKGYFSGDPGTGNNLLLAEEVAFPPASCTTSFEYDKNTFYEHETNTLILRPLEALRETHTYAVVLTRRLTGEDGKPVHSPFTWVNHTRQTPELARLEDALAPVKTTLAEVAFTWAFTVQDATSELHAIRRGLYGSGPFASLDARYPINADSLQLDDLFDDVTALPGNAYALPVKQFINTIRSFVSLLLDSDGAADPLVDTYDNADYLVSGRIKGPNFLVDRDGFARPNTGCDSATPGSDAFDCKLGMTADDDEIFDIDMNTGRMTFEDGDISFWCVIPKESQRQRPGPFPVALYGHGYTSARLEMLGFAGNHARHGIATCAIDSFGHGLAFDPRDMPVSLVRGALAAGGIGRAVEALVPGRARDLNNDGVPDSGGDFWVADAFHTRDIVRQSVIDHMMMVRFLRACDGRLGPDMNDDGVPDKLCDFNADGEVDLGGPDNSYYGWGQSLGGILTGIFAGAEPSLAAAAPTSGAAGLFDVAVRSKQGGVKEAVWLPLMGPIFYGSPTADGSKTQVVTLVSDYNRQSTLPLAERALLSPGDELVISNLRSGKENRVLVKANGTFRTQIGADAINASEKRACLGFEVLHWEHPSFGTELPPVVEDTLRNCSGTLLGDPLKITACEGACGSDLESAKTRWVIDHFEGTPDRGRTPAGAAVEGVYFQGTVYPAGQPLIAVAQGFGYSRQSPDLRRLRGLAGFIVEAGDPAAYSRFYQRDTDEWKARWEGAEPKLDFGTPTEVVVTLGDMNVPVNAGVMNAYLAGYLSFEQLTFLKDNYVLEAVESERADVWGAPVLFDPDNLSQGTDGFQINGVPAPHPAPGEELRATITDPKGKMHGLRLPAILVQGDHGFLVPDPTLPFDVHSFMAHQISHFFLSDGAELKDDFCMHDQSCDWMPPKAQP